MLNVFCETQLMRIVCTNNRTVDFAVSINYVINVLTLKMQCIIASTRVLTFRQVHSSWGDVHHIAHLAWGGPTFSFGHEKIRNPYLLNWLKCCIIWICNCFTFDISHKTRNGYHHQNSRQLNLVKYAASSIFCVKAISVTFAWSIKPFQETETLHMYFVTWF